MQTLVRFGWGPRLQHELDIYPKQLQPVRVISDYGETLEVMAEAGVRSVRISPKNQDRPCVGDWIGLDSDQTICHIFERKTLLLRKAAGTSSRRQNIGANIDTAFITTSANEDFSLRRIERMMAALLSASIRPVVLITKADLTRSIRVFERRAREVAADSPVLSVSAETGEGLEDLHAQMGPGETHMMLGSSGVGKSTIVNHLLGTEQQTVLPIRADGTGRHTTTRRALFAMPRWGALMMDTPGMREFGLGAESNLNTLFSDVEEWMSCCRFRDCSHTVEPGCGVLEALADGSLDPGRWRSYTKLQRELNHLSKRDKAREARELRSARRRR